MTLQLRSQTAHLNPRSAHNIRGEEVAMFARTFVHQKRKMSVTDSRIADVIGKTSTRTQISAKSDHFLNILSIDETFASLNDV